jgi:hypothetical protein
MSAIPVARPSRSFLAGDSAQYEFTSFDASGPVEVIVAPDHEDAFLRPRLDARYRFSKGTLAGTRGNGPDAPISDSCGRGLVLIDDPHRPGATKVSTSQYDRLDGPNVQAHCEARAKSLVDEGSLWSPYQASSGITLSARQSGWPSSMVMSTSSLRS